MLILLYHRVLALPADPWGLAVQPQHFAEHLSILARLGEVVPIDRVIQPSSRPGQQFVVTFDDGYADNLHTALPLLERARMPATFFIVSGMLSASCEFWWDELEQIALNAPSLRPEAPAGVVLPDGCLHPASGSFPRWRAWRDTPPSPRHELFLRLWNQCVVMGADRRNDFLRRLREWAGFSGTPRETHRALRWSEAVALAASPYATIGAHTRTHPRLSGLEEDEVMREIRESKADLEAIVPIIDHFAYPFGGPGDLASETAMAVRATGFGAAFVNGGGRFGATGDRYRIPRLYVHDWAAEEFECEIRGVLAR